MRNFGSVVFCFFMTALFCCGSFGAKLPYRRVSTVKILSLSSQSREFQLLNALTCGDFDAIDALLRGGADVNAILCFTEGSMACQLCAGIIDMRMLHLGKHIWRDAPDMFYRAYPRAADGKTLHGSVRLYGTPLMTAVRMRNEKAVAFLLSRGANPNVFIKLGGDKWLYAMRETRQKTLSQRDALKAARIHEMLVNAGVATIENDDAPAVVELYDQARNAIENLREEERRLVALQQMAQEDIARQMYIASLERRSEEIRGEMAVEEIRQKDRAQQEAQHERDLASIACQTREQHLAARDMCLEKVFHDHRDLYRDGSGNFYKINVDGTVFKLINNGSLQEVKK